MSETPTIEAKHVVAAIYRERVQPNSQGVKDIQQLLITQGGEGVFRAIEEDQIQVDKKPDFGVVDYGIESRTEEEKNLRLKGKNSEADRVEKRHTDVKDQRDILESIYEGKPTPEAKKAVCQILAEIPDFSISISMDLGVTPQEIEEALKTGQPNNIPKLDEIIDNLLASDAIKEKIRRIFTKEEFPKDNIESLDRLIRDLETGIDSEERAITSARKRYIKAREWYEGWQKNQPGELMSFERLYNERKSLLATLSAQELPSTLRRTALSQSDIPTYINALNSYLTTYNIDPLSPDVMTQIRQFSPQDQIKIRAVLSARMSAQQILSMYNIVDPNTGRTYFTDENLAKYEDYLASNQKLQELDEREERLTSKRNELDNYRNKRRKELEKYEDHLLTTLERSVKGYWHSYVLKRAGELAKLEAEKAKKEQEAAKTKEEKFKALMDGFLHLSLFRYDGEGKIIGWDDKFIRGEKGKEGFKQALLQRSPAEMLKFITQHIIDSRTSLPPNYREDVDRILKDLGCLDNAGNFISGSLDTLFGSLPKDFVFQQATERIPNLLGYAWARGYWSDRIRFSKAQAEFLRTAYTPEFFAKALQGKDHYQKIVDDLVGKGVLDLKSDIARQIRKHLIGKDWADIGTFLKALLIVLGIVGLGAGVGILGLRLVKKTFNL